MNSNVRPLIIGEKRGTVTYLVKMITRNGQIDTVWQDHDGTVSTSGTESPHVHYAFNEAMDYQRCSGPAGPQDAILALATALQTLPHEAS